MLMIDTEACIVCGTCAEECHKKALHAENEVMVHEPERCIYCGHCLAVCPRDAIMIDGDGYDIEEVEDLGFAVKPTATQLRNLILDRRSVRHYTDDPVTDEEISKILEAGKYAPTSMNKQDNMFLVVQGKDSKVKFLEDTVAALERLQPQLEESDPEIAAISRERCQAFRNDGKNYLYYDAPVIINVFSDIATDGAIAATMMNLMAETLQLGMCMAVLPARAFMDPQMRAEYKIPEGKQCVMSLLLGNSSSEYFSSVPRKNPPAITI